RIHSIMLRSHVTLQSLHLDILAPGQPVLGSLASGAGRSALRVTLPVAEGMNASHACQRAVDVAGVIRGVRGDLWRGFTLDDGNGSVVFQSWDDPGSTLSGLLRMPN